MLRKFIARLRESIAPAKKPKPAAPHGASRPHDGPAPRKPGQPGAARPQGQGSRRRGRARVRKASRVRARSTRAARYTGWGLPGKAPGAEAQVRGEAVGGTRSREVRRPGPPGGRPPPTPHARRFRASGAGHRTSRRSLSMSRRWTRPSRSSAFVTRWPTRSRRRATPSPRRSRSRPYPLILEGKDVIGSAQTGTGKTAAFALPIIQRLASHGAMRCLILEPTRELALQVEEAFHKYAQFTDLASRSSTAAWATASRPTTCRRGMDILAATPGRLLDHLEQGNCSLGQDRHPRPRRGRPHARHGLPARREAHRPEVPDATGRPSSSPRPFRRKSSSSPAGRCATRRRSRSAARIPPPTPISHALLPGRGPPEVRPPAAPARAHRVQERPDLLPHPHGRRPHRGAPRAEGPHGRRDALRPEPARARRGPRGLQERQDRGAGRHRHRRARPGHRRGLPRDQLRRSREPRGLRPPDRPHRPRPRTRATPSPS